MIKGKTKSGFEYEISPDIQDDYELVEMLGDIEENPLLLARVVKRILGTNQTDQLKEHIRTESGLVGTKAMMKEVQDIFTGTNEVKN